jgi:hypothetical protein
MNKFEEALEKFALLMAFEKQADNGPKWTALERGLLKWVFDNEETIREALTRAQNPVKAVVKPLVWVNDDVAYYARTFCGRYMLFKGLHRWQLVWYSNEELAHGGEDIPCTSLEDGKAQAQAHWEERLAGCVEVVAGLEKIEGLREAATDHYSPRHPGAIDEMDDQVLDRLKTRASGDDEKVK